MNIAVRKSVLSAFVVLASVSGCQSPTESRDGSELALLTTLDGDPMVVLRTETGVVAARPPSGLGTLGEEARTVSADTSVLIFSGGGKLVGFDLNTRAIAWTEQLGSEQASRFAGQTLYANFALALDRDRTHLLVADAHAGSSTGISLLELPSRNAIGFIPDLRSQLILPIYTGPLEGDFLILGTRSPPIGAFETARRQGQLYLIRPSPFSITDSIPFLSPDDSAAGGVAELLLDDTGRCVYYVTFDGRLRKFDLVSRQHVGTLILPHYGSMVLSRDGSSLFMIDETSTFDDPGSGQVYIVDSELTRYAILDLSEAGMDGVPPVLNSIAISRDGKSVYVGAGTARRGPFYGVQEGAIIVLDAVTGRIERVHRQLGAWGIRRILVMRG